MSGPYYGPASPFPHRTSWLCLFVTPVSPPQPDPSTLQSPLESLELAFCALLPEGLRLPSLGAPMLSTSKLDLSGNGLSGSQLEPFQGLLQAAAASSCTRADQCQLADTFLATPVLTRCASLRYLGLCSSPLSMAGSEGCCGAQPSGAGWAADGAPFPCGLL